MVMGLEWRSRQTKRLLTSEIDSRCGLMCGLMWKRVCQRSAESRGFSISGHSGFLPHGKSWQGGLGSASSLVALVSNTALSRWYRPAWTMMHVRPTMNKLPTMLFQVATVEQCCNNMLTILFIVGRTTFFTPVDINLQQVVDFLNFYACRDQCENNGRAGLMGMRCNTWCNRSLKSPDGEWAESGLVSLMNT
jgi:hypothetical protein